MVLTTVYFIDATLQGKVVSIAERAAYDSDLLDLRLSCRYKSTVVRIAISNAGVAMSREEGEDSTIIKEVWTDMRLLSLRRQMEEAARQDS